MSLSTLGRVSPIGPGSKAMVWQSAGHFRSTPINRYSQCPPSCPKGADSVAKVFLRHGSQILRGVGAAIEQRCGGPRRHTPNSQAILAAGLRLYRAAIVACFVLWREFSSCGFWDFCNTIGTFRTWHDVRLESAFGGIAEVGLWGCQGSF